MSKPTSADVWCAVIHVTLMNTRFQALTA